MFSRRVIAGLLTLWTLVFASGVPLPIARVSITPQTSEERFPCEKCPCGCSTAAYCWRSCCCHTLAQRLAWARREGVRPPESALDDAERAGLDVSTWREAATYRVAPVVELTSAQQQELEELPPCCRAARRAQLAEESSAAKQPENPQKRPTPQGVSVIAALACQGLTQAWLALGEAPVAEAAELITIEVSAPAIEQAVASWESRTEPPSPPPPKVAALL